MWAGAFSADLMPCQECGMRAARCGLSHALEDEDVVQIVKRKVGGYLTVPCQDDKPCLILRCTQTMNSSAVSSM